jgi:hypothetical protein
MSKIKSRDEITDLIAATGLKRIAATCLKRPAKSHRKEKTVQ